MMPEPPGLPDDSLILDLESDDLAVLLSLRGRRVGMTKGGFKRLYVVTGIDGTRTGDGNPIKIRLHLQRTG